MEIEPNLRVFITGKTQSGKSYFAKYLLKYYKNYIIYDIKREYSKFGAVVHSLDDLKNAIYNGCNRLVYQPNDLSAEHFDEICDFIFAELKNILFLVDEVHNYCQKMKITMGFKRIITVAQGDPYNIGVIAITQRPANTHNDIISNSSLIISFKLNLEDDSKAIEKNTGIPYKDLQNLEYNHFIVYNDRDKSNLIQKFTPIKA